MVLSDPHSPHCQSLFNMKQRYHVPRGTQHLKMTIVVHKYSAWHETCYAVSGNQVVSRAKRLELPAKGRANQNRVEGQSREGRQFLVELPLRREILSMWRSKINRLSVPRLILFIYFRYYIDKI